MNDKRSSEHATPVDDDDDDENGRNAAIIAADDTGLLTGESILLMRSYSKVE
jgi:hypothetical protein